jgi:hypothetical protein
MDPHKKLGFFEKMGYLLLCAVGGAVYFAMGVFFWFIELIKKPFCREDRDRN